MLSDFHPALTSTTVISDYCQLFFNKYNLNYFQVIRVNRDGSSTVMTNRADFTRHCVQHAIKHNVPLIYSSVNNNFLNKSSYYFLWEKNLPVAPVAMVRNEFNMANGLTFVERYPTHYYMFAFAAPVDNTGVLDFYINNIQIIQNFIQTFKMQHQALLLQAEQSPFILPPPLIDENLDKMLLTTTTESKRIPVSYQGQTSFLTLKEYECIKLLPLGLSAKEIGKKLNISPRTIETYLQRAKLRTGCIDKRSLIELLLSIPGHVPT